MSRSAEIETRLFPDDGRTPNHPTLPLIVMRHTEAADAEDPAEWFEERYAANGWGSTWRWGVYSYQHFHSTNHEVLGVARGSASLMLGGEEGGEFRVAVGDVLVLPAGYGHMCLSASEDFQVVGAYPRGEKVDLIRPSEGNLDAARGRIEKVPLPERDPVYGEEGPVMEFWR
ncbi:cupin domain-containing protein [Haloferula sp. BvORR071]|uniref:cupin domain-containing protein n=1 Tax=Haloferula sp. BvORR071 TaxID=1396141 RepID=UPI00054DC07C|nr:cupin domain-containing protein [Haloferula sp. BvORR071]